MANKSIQPKLSAEEKKWRAKDDAYTLIQAGAIQSDKSRMNSALKEVKAIAVQKEKEAKAAKKIVKAPKKRVKAPKKRAKTKKIKHIG